MRRGLTDRADAVPRRWLAGTGTGLVALLIAASLGLSACSGGNTGNAAASDAQGRAAAGAPGQAAQGGQAQDGASTGSGSQANGAGSNGAAIRLSNRSLIITAGLQVKTDDAAAAAQRAQIIAEGAGGYVAGESIGPGPQTTPTTAPSMTPDGSSSGGTTENQGPAPATLPDVTGASDATQALLVLRVPPQSLDSVLGALAGKGSVTYQSRTATDVTGQVADVASRVGSARAAIAELRTLIDKAASVNDLIALEQALAQRESDLESLEAQQAALADQVQYATITVGYYSQGAPAPPPPPVRTGFMRGLTVGWHGFRAVVRALLAAAGWLVPYAAVILVLWWPVRRLVRRAVRRRLRGPAGGSAPSGAAAGPGPGPASGH